MKNLALLTLGGILAITTAFTPDGEKLITKTGHINFFSHTMAEDISADNFKVTSTLNPATGEMVFSVPMQSFEFPKALMQKHFNSPKFLDTKQFPKAKFKGSIANFNEVDLSKDGTYNVSVKGDLTIHGVTKTITEKGTVTVKGKTITANTKFKIVLADYKVAFEKGKPSTNVSKEVDATVKINYEQG